MAPKHKKIHPLTSRVKWLESKMPFEDIMSSFRKAYLEFENNKPKPDEQEERLEMTMLFYAILSVKLEDLIATKSWYVGILLSSSFLEDMGKRYLRLTFRDKINSSKIDRLTLEEVIMLLLACGAIDCELYQKLMEVKEARNKLAHDPFKAMSLFLKTGYSNSKEAQRAKSIINKAAFCLNLRPLNMPVPDKCTSQTK